MSWRYLFIFERNVNDKNELLGFEVETSAAIFHATEVQRVSQRISASPVFPAPVEGHDGFRLRSHQMLRMGYPGLLVQIGSIRRAEL